MEDLLEKLEDELEELDDNLLTEKEKVLLEYAKKDVPEAYLYLGDLYYFDLDDKNKAIDYYIKAGNMNIGQAIYMQAIIYTNPFFREQNLDKAKECLLKAANEYDVDDAIYELGFNYYSGLNGFEKDYNKAVEYFEKSANNNNPEALCSLARCYAYGFGVAQDYKKAYELEYKAFLELNNQD